MQLPARSVIAGGLSSLAIWGLGLLLPQLGIILPPMAISGAVAVVGAIVTHFVPDSLKNQADALNVSVKDLANWLPTVEQVYPDQDKQK